MYSRLVPNLLPRRDEGSGKPSYSRSGLVEYLAPTRDSIDPGTSGSTVPSSNHYTTAAHGEAIVKQ